MAQSSEYEDYYRYTSGRWLWAEEERLQERYKRFNVSGLKQLAAKTCGAKSCVGIVKLAEGGFNKVFRLSMDNGSVVIARIPNPNIGPASKVMASEVATMDFVQNVLDIPVAKVLAWDGGISNSAESEYILMEQAKGKQLDELWTDMDLDDKVKVVDDVIEIQRKLQSVNFSKHGYGNLYFKSDSFEGCSLIEISGDLSPSRRSYAEDRFVIGPVAEKAFWETGTASTFCDRGPWPDAQSYLRAISQRERSKMPSSPRISATETSPQNDFSVLDSPQSRLSLLDKFDALSPFLPPINSSLNKATLSHWDIRGPNIFVEGGRIGIEDKEEKAKLTNKVERSILYWYYGQETQKRNPTLQELFHLPLARKRRETVLFASEVWDGESIPLRECLYHLQRNWDKLQTGNPCPIKFTNTEIEAHDRVSADWNEKADFWDSLSGFVSRDGYTSVEDYEEARKWFQELRVEGLAHLEGTQLKEFEEGSRWAAERRS